MRNLDRVVSIRAKTANIMSTLQEMVLLAQFIDIDVKGNFAMGLGQFTTVPFEPTSSAAKMSKTKRSKK